MSVVKDEVEDKGLPARSVESKLRCFQLSSPLSLVCSRHGDGRICSLQTAIFRVSECVDHRTYYGRSYMMEGIWHEGALAGTWGLGKLTAFWDDNDISIDGPSGSYTG